MIHHRPASSFITALAVTSVMFSGCTAAPQPSPTPTAAFASEEEAFAAAEETYRAYNDAFNDIDVSDPSTFERLFEVSSGDFEAADRETLSGLHADGYMFVGEIEVVAFEGVSSSRSLDRVLADVCVDLSRSDIVNDAGGSVVNADRPDVNPLRVSFHLSRGRFLIERADVNESLDCEPR
ncbi:MULTISPECIES: hypothetical protein [unclassified Microbacterium]|uniref:hypothetical protein n=1 Tax=unclassified Microbacterium TaxID=2609290 RepID=UPI000EAABD01|nr:MULTISPECIES: hypothetical protein [unclassified Microbacterium]MBT2486305.1 hypothetical protein [Microbacterium sp. ISL-108]RKN69018.1 hypothetical protein D7252_16500 [Microbacterium sp. CGR2]